MKRHFLRVVCSDEELETWVGSVLRPIREKYENSTFITIIEQNYGGWVGASRVATICDVFQPCMHMSRDTSAQRRIGCVTTHETKEAMRISLQQLLRAEKIMFASKFFSLNLSAKGEICDQLKNYRYIDKVGPVQNKKILTGKINGKNDDLCITTCMLSYWPHFFFANQQTIRRLRM